MSSERLCIAIDLTREIDGLEPGPVIVQPMDFFSKTKYLPERIVKGGFGSTIIGLLEIVNEVYGSKRRNEVAKEIIGVFKDRICAACPVVGACSTVKVSRAFSGEVKPEAYISKCDETEQAFCCGG